MDSTLPRGVRDRLFANAYRVRQHALKTHGIGADGADRTDGGANNNVAKDVRIDLRPARRMDQELKTLERTLQRVLPVTDKQANTYSAAARLCTRLVQGLVERGAIKSGAKGRTFSIRARDAGAIRHVFLGLSRAVQFLRKMPRLGTYPTSAARDLYNSLVKCAIRIQRALERRGAR
jgi:hypothetical protein